MRFIASFASSLSRYIGPVSELPRICGISIFSNKKERMTSSTGVDFLKKDKVLRVQILRGGLPVRPTILYELLGVSVPQATVLYGTCAGSCIRRSLISQASESTFRSINILMIPVLYGSRTGHYWTLEGSRDHLQYCIVLKREALLPGVRACVFMLLNVCFVFPSHCGKGTSSVACRQGYCAVL
jgi:hypothetical protein